MSTLPVTNISGDLVDVLHWLRSRRDLDQHLVSRGHQAKVYLYRDGSRKFIIKAPYGRGPAQWLRCWMLRREEKAYERVQGVAGLPRCFGLLDGKYLLLEYFESVPVRAAKISDRESFFAALREMIDGIHAAGVAHGDLKTRNNIMVTADCRPHIVDFGIAVIRKPGFAPFNHWLFRMFVHFDRNAWIKLKYKGRWQEISPEDASYHHLTWVELLIRKVRGVLRRIRKLAGGTMHS